MGYRLDRAIGTTYSVDLLSLLAVPLSFAQLDWAEDRDKLLADPVTLLRSLREHAGRVTLFCQVGRIAAPTARHPLFAYLEPMIVQAVAPRGGEFHAKTWVLRFEAGGDEPVLYRFVCLSRNLTDDRSWDTILCLDGELQDRQRAIGPNHPLGEFLEALPGLAHGPVRDDLGNDIQRLASEIRKVRFEVPEPFEGIEFFPLGIEGHEGIDLDARGTTRMVVVSPFLSKGFLEDQAVADEVVLVSRQQSLDEMDQDVLRKFKKVFVLDDGAYLDSQSSEDDVEEVGPAPDDEAADPRGLHAKLFVIERGWDVEVLTGSANATTAAFQRNVEFLVQLTAKKSKAGVRALLGAEDSKGFSFGSLLREYAYAEQSQSPDEEGAVNEKAVDDARRTISGASMALHVRPASVEGLHDVELALGSAVVLDSRVRAKCWLASQPPGSGWNVATLAGERKLVFEKLSTTQLTAFLCVEAEAGSGDSVRRVRFALVLPLDGAPADRMEQVLAGVLQEPGQFLRFLLFLLQDPDVDPAGVADLVRGLDPGRLANKGHWSLTPLLEDLLRAVARSPERLRDVHRLVEDLKRSPAGAKVLPPGFESVWQPIWEASGVTA